MHGLIQLGWMALLLVCSGPAWSREILAEKYRVTVSVDVETPNVPEELKTALQKTRWDVNLLIALEPVRQFRDGSIGWLLRFEEVEEVIHDGAGATPVPRSALQGLSVELRAFEDGEVLDLDLAGHIAGWGRGGDVLDVLVPILSPAPPPSIGKEPTYRMMIWPFRIGKAVRWDNAVRAKWTDESPDERGAKDPYQYAYAGPWSIKGRDTRMSPQMRIGGTGEVSGTLEVEHKTGRILSHEFDWSREVKFRADGGGHLTQQHRFVGSMERAKP